MLLRGKSLKVGKNPSHGPSRVQHPLAILSQTLAQRLMPCASLTHLHPLACAATRNTSWPREWRRGSQHHVERARGRFLAPPQASQTAPRAHLHPPGGDACAPVQVQVHARELLERNLAGRASQPLRPQLLVRPGGQQHCCRCLGGGGRCPLEQWPHAAVQGHAAHQGLQHVGGVGPPAGARLQHLLAQVLAEQGALLRLHLQTQPRLSFLLQKMAGAGWPLLVAVPGTGDDQAGRCCAPPPA